MQDTKNPVLIAYGYTFNQSSYTHITSMLDEHGMVQLDFYPPNTRNNISYPLNIEVKIFLTKFLLYYKYIICNNSNIFVQAQYLNLHELFPSTNQATSLSHEYIQANLKTEKPMVYFKSIITSNISDIIYS